jgi:tetratricopeptide (TPR) repeat protein
MWKVATVKWVEKDFEYVPWGDLLGYWYLDDLRGARSELGLRPADLPGFVSVTVGVVDALHDLDNFDRSLAAGPVLDLARRLHGTRILDLVLDDLATRMAGRRDLTQRLLQELDARYRAKDRNLDDLRRQLQAARRLVPVVGDEAPVRTRVLWTAVELQAASHEGAPERAQACAAAWDALRPKALEVDRELVAFVDANLAVHLADRMELDAARATMEAVVGDRFFEALTPVSRARAHSSLGQYLSMQGRHAEAEERFELALAEIGADVELGPERKDAERDQTACYRAINACDGALDGALDRVRDVLGNDLVGRASALARAGGSLSPYHHHLLVRTIWFHRELKEARQAYLEGREAWTTGEHHPWGLVALYRALLARESEPGPEEAQRWFGEALRLATAPGRGLTLRLIGAMIATVANCCLDDGDGAGGYSEQADSLLAEVERALPSAGPIVSRLRDVLASPGAERIDEALRALPFGYH